jgi:hypothetical protein
MTSTHTANLNLPHLPTTATHTDLFPALGTTNLLSIGKLCDADCVCTFTKDQATIKLNNETILSGPRSDTQPKLWEIELPLTQYAGNAVNHSAKPADLVAFSHATLFSPPITTLAEALRKDYISGFPGLTKQTLSKYPPQSMATIKGHLDQSRTNQKRSKSTKITPEINVSDLISIMRIATI